MSERFPSLRRRRVLETAAIGGLGALAGCSGTDLGTGEEPQPEPDKPPEAIRNGVDVDALRDRTARALGEAAFAVTGRVSSLGDGTVQNSQAKSARGDPGAETARHASASSSDTELEDPTAAEAVLERFYSDDEVYRRRTRDGDTEFERDDADYGAFVRRVRRDLESFYEVATSLRFGDPKWDDDRGVYLVEATGLDEETAAETETEVAIETCRVRVSADGVVVGIESTLSLGASERVRAVVDGDTGSEIAVEEPAWMDEVDADLPLWTFRTGERPSATVRDGTVLVSSDEVVALDRDNGSPRWRFSIDWEDDDVTNGSFHAVAGETVFVGTNERDVYARSLTDGSERWSNTVETPLPRPTVIDDVVVFAGLGGVRAFRVDDGSAAWTWSPEQSVARRFFHDGTLFVADTTGVVTAIDATSGAERWQTDAPTRNWVSPSAASSGRLYAGAFEGFVYGFDADDGSVAWRYATDDTTVSVAHDDGTVYAGDRSGGVYALNEDGTERWRFDAGDTARPHPRGDSVYVGSHDGSVYRLSAESGAVRWTFETGGWVEQPAVTEDGVYVGSRDSNLYAVERDTGETRWEREVSSWVRPRPTVRDGVVYATDLGTGGGAVYAFDTHPER